MNKLKLYDRKLSYKKHLDGTIEILRQSMYNKRNEHSIIKFENQFAGSLRWIVEKLKSMDSTRIDFFTPVIQKGINRRREVRSDDRMHRDIAEFIRNGSQFVG